MQGLILQSFIDELLTRIDIVEFIDSYVPLKKRGSSYIACCPFHNEKSPSFNVIAKKQFYHCFGCGASGNVISFAMSYLQQSFPDAIETLASKVGLQVVYENNKKNNDQNHPSLYQILNNVSKFYQQALKSSEEAISYLKKRGLSGEIASIYQIGYAPDGWQILESKFKSNSKELLLTGMLIKKDNGSSYDRYRQRIIFPIHDRRGRIIGFGGRAIKDGQTPKYLNSPETILFQKNRELYGLYQIIQKDIDKSKIIIVEGYMDVLALAQHGIGNVVATLGTATSTYHIQLLSKYTREIVFCFDGDKAGRQAAWRALESTLLHLDEDLVISFVFLPEAEDPDSLIRKNGKIDFLNRVENAISFSQFFFDTLLQGLDLSTVVDKSKLLNKATPYLIKMVDGSYRQLLINELARLTRIENHRILQLLAKKNVLPEIKESQSNTVARSPMRIAIAILLQSPMIYSEEKNLFSLLKSFDKPPRVLLKIMQQIAEKPDISTASLVELWRRTPLFDAINDLASYDHQVPNNSLAKEFHEIILFLKKQDQENKIQLLIEKSRKVSLTESERQELQRLLKQRHNLTYEQ